ncbi:cytochrome-c oxidase [Mesobacillus jeotgali]|uniref:Cytochrome-c oxidase n=1 Tax=Mesobacillus jeotgali TaxID=129985 RepID=A0ABY9VG51_9BACI|nr:cytochrome-c oxidase [Mesobacillus jeotgali]WNF22914.1 cytochrome-c oxidase [Mesobacillus jeotgali]
MSIRFFRIAAVYFVIAIILGIIMGIAHDFTLTSVHAHLNLLGWVSMALFGMIYHFYPEAGNSKLASTHFWLHNIGVPVMQGGIALSILIGGVIFTVFAIIASLLVVLGGILFMVNVFKHVKA